MERGLRQVKLSFLIASLGVFFGLCCPGAEAAGPWKGQVVDAETGQPVEGVVVLAYWIRYSASVGGWAGGEYYASDEVVTAADGRFEIPARIAFNWLPFFTTIRGPEFTMFKPGYGRWRPRSDEDSAAFESGREGVVELLPLKTREERLKFHVEVASRMMWKSEARSSGIGTEVTR